MLTLAPPPGARTRAPEKNKLERPVRRESGEGYVLVLRPEQIRIAQPDEGSDLGPVTVTSTAYKGRDIEVAERLVRCQSLKFLLSADRDVCAPEPGSSIEIR